MRLFIALELDETAHRRLKQLIEQLRTTAAKVRWMEAANVHLTLKFLGEVPDAQAPEVCRAAGEVAAAGAPVEFEIAGVGAFPNLHAPRVIWAGVPTVPQEMAALHERLEEAFDRLGYGRENRRFHPHLTLGRAKSRRDVADLADRLGRYADWAADAPQDCSELIVFSSDLTREGPVYTAVHRAPLARE